jgi:DNA end-binding protein Ku
VVIDTDELEKLRSEDSKALTVQEFVPFDALDPMYYSGTTYYLVPDGPVGQRPYSVLHEGLVEQERNAICQVVWHGKEQVVVVRPVDGLLTMTALSYDHQVTKPAAFEDEVPKTEINPDELKLIKTLIAASTKKKFDFSVYKDVYTEKLTQLIEAKVAGKEIVAAQPQEHAQIINLMDALKQSVEKLGGQAEAEEKPPMKMAPSKKGRAPAERKKKSS